MIIFHYLMYRLYERAKVSAYSDMPLFYSCIAFMCFFQVFISLIIIFLINNFTGITITIPYTYNKFMFFLCITLPVFIIDYLFYSKVVNIEKLSEKYKERKFWLDKVNWIIIYAIYNILSFFLLIFLILIFKDKILA